MKITIVAGARPNFMKIAPITRAIEAARALGKSISYRLVYTGRKDDTSLDASLFSDLDGVWQQFFTEKPEVLTREEKRAWLNTMTGVALGSDAFFPFGDNIERAHKSGVSYIAQPGGSVRDDHVIGTCDKYNMAMAFTGIRLFHH